MTNDRRPSSGKPQHLYLAGPFFNAAQIAIIQRIESALCKAPYPSGEFSFFSPRAQPLNTNPTSKLGPMDSEKAQEIFKKDYLEITKSTVVLAVMDWALPPGQEVRVVEPAKVDEERVEIVDEPSEGSVMRSYRTGGYRSGPIKLPDSGTVWEMGCAYALRVPVVLFTQDPAARVNLMLSQSCKGVLYGWDKLDDWIQSGFDLGALESWKGEHR